MKLNNTYISQFISTILNIIAYLATFGSNIFTFLQVRQLHLLQLRRVLAIPFLRSSNGDPILKFHLLDASFALEQIIHELRYVFRGEGGSHCCGYLLRWRYSHYSWESEAEVQLLLKAWLGAGCDPEPFE